MGPTGNVKPPANVKRLRAVARIEGSPFIETLQCLLAGGIQSRPRRALGLLETGKPGRSSLRRDAGGNDKRILAAGRADRR
eukprot:766787-Pyramimonas_sp.AAC.1